MTYDRGYGRRQGNAPRGRSFEDNRYDREDRGFFERARDEVSSWFGDDEAEARRNRDERFDEPRSSRRQPYAGERDRDYGRYDSPRHRDEGNRRPYTGSRPSFGEDYGPARAYSSDRWDRGQTQGQGYGASQGNQWSQQNRDFTGSASGMHDRDYSSWRNRQIDELDRDYDEFRRENSARFENEFTSWRTGRQTKKQMLSQLTEHMDVVGSDGETVGKVDHIKSDKIILTKNDSADGRHHVIGCSRFDRIEDGKLFLDQPAAEIQQSFEQQKRSRALFEEERDDDNGPHMLNRSFSGTY